MGWKGCQKIIHGCVEIRDRALLPIRGIQTWRLRFIWVMQSAQDVSVDLSSELRRIRAKITLILTSKTRKWNTKYDS